MYKTTSFVLLLLLGGGGRGGPGGQLCQDAAVPLGGLRLKEYFITMCGQAKIPTWCFGGDGWADTGQGGWYILFSYHSVF